MQPLKPEEKSKILEGRPHLENSLNKYEQLLSEKFYYEPNDPKVLEIENKLNELRNILFPQKTVKFPVWDQETDEIIDMEMDEDSYRAMCEAEDKAQKEQEERYAQMLKEDQETLWWAIQNDRD